MPSNKIPPSGGGQPKPRPKRPKGKKPKPPRHRAAPKIKPLDVFKTILNADAGTDSSRGKMKGALQALSESQLDKLEKIIQRLQRKVFKNTQERERHLKVCDQITDAIAKRKEESDKVVISIEMQIKQKIDQLPISEHEEMRNCLQGNRIFTQNLVKKHFQKEIDLIDQLFHEGILIRKWVGQKPETLVKSIVHEYLNQ